MRLLIDKKAKVFEFANHRTVLPYVSTVFTYEGTRYFRKVPRTVDCHDCLANALVWSGVSGS